MMRCPAFALLNPSFSSTGHCLLAIVQPCPVMSSLSIDDASLLPESDCSFLFSLHQTVDDSD